MNSPTIFFDPYSYQPKVASYFMGRPAPSEVSTVAANNPAAASHIMSIWQFTVWLNQMKPELYSAIAGTNPALLDPASVVLMGKLNAPVLYGAPDKAPAIEGTGTTPTQTAGMKGLGDATSDASAPSDGIITEWGKQVSDVLKNYLAYDQQKQLIALNIKRAEQGLSPVSSADFAAGVNIGLADSTQKMLMLGFGVVLLVGVAAAFRRSK